eukprot:2842584-Rhodomonas_salina.3
MATASVESGSTWLHEARQASGSRRCRRELLCCSLKLPGSAVRSSMYRHQASWVSRMSEGLTQCKSSMHTATHRMWAARLQCLRARRSAVVEAAPG